uniref:Furin-like_2 domain-containing protein n=1 Tax=Bursaphelenchus xylophilus TaxID=6326 RepID=A0A1I7SP08_BURXY
LECVAEKPIDPAHCSPFCQECDSKRRSTFHCKTCLFNLISDQNLKTCVGPVCPYAYYEDKSKKTCERCHRNCLTCAGPLGGYKKDCVRCQILYFDAEKKKGTYEGCDDSFIPYGVNKFSSGHISSYKV